MTTPDLLQNIDYALLGAGAVLVVGAGIRLGVQNRWRAAIALPDSQSNRLELVDVLFSLLCVFVLPPMAGQLLGFAGFGVTDGPAKFVSLGIGLALAIAALIAIGSSRFEGGLRGWGLTTDRPGRIVRLALIGYLVAAPICFAGLKLSTWLLTRLGHPSPQHDTIKLLMDPSTPPSVKSVAIFHAVILAALAEELLFRGILQPAIAKWSRSPWTGILISGGLFGLIHHPYDDTILPLAAFGIILGFLYAKTGRLSLAILTHAMFNAKTILWLLLGATPD
ncbi:MAG TPA: CPBP family intramembrane glutamic endopeptidase [Phycisphaerae bacterium]|nr:CPBP family intramembrane glutamic endopeptidase [Phycisphaerae bacterium]